MTISHVPAIERIARVVAGQRLSSNADGDDPHAAAEVDLKWKDYRDTALAILKTLREPDARMAEAGDADQWRRMIEAAMLQI